MTKRKVLILSAANPTRAYSGIKYLFKELERNEHIVNLWAAVPDSQKNEYSEWGANANSFFFRGFGKIPVVRLWWMKIMAILIAFKYRNQAIICHELTFYKTCYLLKRFFPNTIIIHYCTELFDENSPKKFLKQLKFYEKHPDVADLVIECDEMRRKYREEKYHISKPSVTIYNTIPKSELEKYVTKKIRKNEVAEIVYTGAAYGHRQLDMLIDAVEKITVPYKMKFYVYGPEASIQKLEELCIDRLGKGKYEVISNTPREKLFDKVSSADIGIVYYNPTLSIGNKFASPTKFFEYVGMGIPVVSSHNDSLVDLIDSYDLGMYMENQSVEAMYNCINILASDSSLRNRIAEHEILAFNDYLCYEKQSKKAFEIIEELLKSNIRKDKK